MTIFEFPYPALAAPFIGSFLGVVILRLPQRRRLVAGRSRCDHCHHVLGVRDLVPVVSWLAARGRCRFCAAPLGFFYPTIEIATLAIAFWAGQELSGWVLWAGCTLGWTLLALATIDWRHLVLPDVLTLPLIPAGLMTSSLLDPDNLLPHLLGAAAGYGLFALTRAVYTQVRGAEGLGLGDAKLLAAAGAWLSWQALPSVILIASVSGLTAVLIGRLAGRRIVRSDPVPFGPCICLAIWAVWLYGPLTLGPGGR